jgi:hypothetical protein
MKVSTEIDNNCGYEKITQLVDNIHLNKHSLIWPTFENFIVSHGQHANFLPESCLIDFIAIDC